MSVIERCPYLNILREFVLAVLCIEIKICVKIDYAKLLQITAVKNQLD